MGSVVIFFLQWVKQKSFVSGGQGGRGATASPDIYELLQLAKKN